jgi:hypothetical protein
MKFVEKKKNDENNSTIEQENERNTTRGKLGWSQVSIFFIIH